MKMRRLVCGVLALSLTGGSLYVPMAHAALVSTDQVVADATLKHSADAARARLAALLARNDVAAALQNHGIDVELARARVDRLTDAEVLQMAGQIDELPAGGDVLGVIVFLFLVLLITDILGFTDIFPFVKKR